MEGSQALAVIGIPHRRLVVLGRREQQVAVVVVHYRGDRALVPVENDRLLLVWQAMSRAVTVEQEKREDVSTLGRKGRSAQQHRPSQGLPGCGSPLQRSCIPEQELCDLFRVS